MSGDSAGSDGGAPAPALTPDFATTAAWRGVSRARLAALGRHLRQLGLTEPALRHCFGVRCPAHAPTTWRVHLWSESATQDAMPASLLLYVFVAGAAVPYGRLRGRLGDSWPVLRDLGLIAVDDERAWATVAILPVGEALVVSDRADVLNGSESALLCDDSAFHLIGAVPERASGVRWLDIGTGSGVVPLARPAAAARVIGSDINRRAVAMAALGAALSGITHMTFQVADLFAGLGADERFERITFNAPIPADVVYEGEDPASYRIGAPDLLPRFWAQVRAWLAPGGEVLVHSWQPLTDYPAALKLSGRVVAVRYTPAEERTPFGITVWQPDLPDECRMIPMELGDDDAHVSRAELP
ncbi:MAG: methyltransferase domain-containing protein [Myxococcota bacterium]